VGRGPVRRVRSNRGGAHSLAGLPLGRSLSVVPNPYAGSGRVRTAHESVSELEQFVGRLRKLGATDGEVGQVVDGWDVLDDDWTLERRREFARSTDEQIVADLAAVRAEYAAGSSANPDGTLADAARVVDQSAAKVLAWVDGDPARAAAVLPFERMSPDGGRKTLIASLTKIVG